MSTEIINNTTQEAAQQFAGIILQIINEDDQQHELDADDLSEMILFPENVAEEDMDDVDVRLEDFREGLDYMYMHRYVYNAKPSNEVIDLALERAKELNLNLPFYG